MEDNLNIIVSSLPDYVEEKRDEIIRKLVLGGNTIRHMVPQTGIKTSAKINYIDIDPEFQDGLGCGFSAQEGGIELTQREIVTGMIKVNITVCPDKLLGKYAEYLVKIGATEEELPFEQYIVDGIIDAINAKLEKQKMLEELKRKLAAGEDDTVNVTFGAGASAWDAIKAVILAIPELALSKGKCVVFVSAELYRQFVLELVEKNFYHYSGPQDEAPEEIIFPGTNITVAKANGLNGTGYIYATVERNLYYGCDLQNNKEEVKIWWSDDDDIFKIKVKWNSGVQTAFPDLVVLGHAGEGPTPSEVTVTGSQSFSYGSSAGSYAETYATSDGGGVTAEVPAAAADWLAATVNGNIVTFALQANAGEARTATVRISTATPGATGYLDVAIAQDAPAPAPVVTISGENSLEYDAAGGSFDETFATSDGGGVAASVPVEAADWLAASVNGNIVSFTLQANAGASRSATVRISTATPGATGYLDITVEQDAPAVQPVTIQGPTLLEVGASAATIRTRFQASDGSMPSVNVPEGAWFSVQHHYASEFDITVEQNASAEADRSGQFTVTTVTGGYLLVNISQVHA